MEKANKIINDFFNKGIITDESLRVLAQNVAKEAILLEDLNQQESIWINLHNKLNDSAKEPSKLNKLEIIAIAANEVVENSKQRQALIRGLTNFQSVVKHNNSVIKKQNEENKIAELPETTKEIVDKIKKVEQQLTDNRESLTIDEQSTADNLLKKRIPEVIKQYLSITPEDRQILNESNERSEDVLALVEETLNNYKTKLDEIVLRINISKVRDLRVSKIYSKSLIAK